MIDWSFPPDLQAQYDRVLAQTRRLQAELGVQPMTIEERAESYRKKKLEQAQKQQELEELQKRIGRTRPMPTWKV